MEAGNGFGNHISEKRARAIIDVLTPPISLRRLDRLELYDDASICRPCGTAYCGVHWSPSSTGYGRCPRGHGKSLDPHH